MDKEKFYLAIALKCVSFPNRCEFRFDRIIDEDDSLRQAVEQIYGVAFPNIDKYYEEQLALGIKEDDINEDDLWKAWKSVMNLVKKDTARYVEGLSVWISVTKKITGF